MKIDLYAFPPLTNIRFSVLLELHMVSLMCECTETKHDQQVPDSSVPFEGAPGIGRGSSREDNLAWRLVRRQLISEVGK